jgi:hypothetical protein
VQHLHILLFHGVEADKAHRRAAHRLRDAGGIVRIVLVALHVGFDVLRRHQLRGEAEPIQLARPVMRAPGGFDPDHTRRQGREEPQHLAATEFLLHHHLPVRIHAVGEKHVLCHIQTNGCNIHLDSSFISLRLNSASQAWHSTMPLGIKGGVHFIRVRPTHHFFVDWCAGRTLHF